MDSSLPIIRWAQRLGWGLWLSLLVVLPLGAIAFAVQMLTALPDSTYCPRHFDGEQSESLRLYCAQRLADEGTPDSLQRAIALVDRIPLDHPVRESGERFLQEWSFRLLAIAEQRIQAGDLDGALTLARQISPRTDAYIEARDRMDAWQAVWQRAEQIYNRSEDAIALGDWSVALQRSRELLTLDNQYWVNRYQDIARRAQEGRERDQWLADAAKRRQSNLVTTTEGRRSQWEAERDQRDLALIQQAQSLAQSGSVEDLRAAVTNARRIIWGTPHYDQAQALIATWQGQIQVIEDGPRLDYARQVASSGDVRDLELAIREARRIPSYRSLHPEAQRQIEEWQQQIRSMTAESMQRSVPPGPQPVVDDRLAPWTPPTDPRSPLNPDWNPDLDERFSDSHGEVE